MQSRKMIIQYRTRLIVLLIHEKGASKDFCEKPLQKSFFFKKKLKKMLKKMWYYNTSYAKRKRDRIWQRATACW